mgnify:CR=1 FL=1
MSCRTWASSSAAVFSAAAAWEHGDEQGEARERGLGQLSLDMFPVDQGEHGRLQTSFLTCVAHIDGAGFPGFTSWPQLTFDALLQEYGSEGSFPEDGERGSAVGIDEHGSAVEIPMPGKSRTASGLGSQGRGGQARAAFGIAEFLDLPFD